MIKDMLIMLDKIQIRWTANSILEFLHDHADHLQAMGVRKIGLFGSYVRGEEQPDSDIDILIEMNTASYRDYMNVLHFLEDNFERKVDLGEEHLIKAFARTHIMKEVRFAEGF